MTPDGGPPREGGADALTCGAGYREMNGQCVDIDECAEHLAMCPPGSTCRNTPGSFACSCAAGSIWNGSACARAGVRTLEVGTTHACSIEGGGLSCWGGNVFGQLGDGTTVRAAMKTRIGTDSDWLQVAAAGIGLQGTTCATRTDKSLWCWGISALVRTTVAHTPTRIGTDTDWEQIDDGTLHGCGVKTNGTLWCWGDNEYGQLGVPGTGPLVTSPIQVGADADWVEVATGDAHTCARKASGALWCWGVNQAGEVGIGSTIRQNAPVQVGTDLDWQQIEAGAVNTCAVKTGGSLWCWGSDTVGQLGDGVRQVMVSTPLRIGTDTDWREVEVGGGYTCAIKQAGSLWCWGTILGTATSVTNAPARMGAASDWARVSVFSGGLAAGGTACAENHAGEVWCWGQNLQGTLAMGTFGSKSQPSRVGTEAWTSVAAFAFSSCGVKADGTLWCWGANETGIYGGTPGDYQNPFQVTTDTGFTEVTLGSSHQCARKGGAIYCWGSGYTGALGLGSGTMAIVTAPTRVGTDGDWTMLVAGAEHTCGLRAGQVYCWGRNNAGQVGDGTTVDRYVPTRVGTASDWTAVSAGQGSCGIEAGALYCWGGWAGSRSTPLAIGTGTDWTAISVGYARVCGVRAPGTLWCLGQYPLGDGSFTSSDMVPVRAGPDTDWAGVSTLDSVTCAWKTDGSLWCWGADFAVYDGGATFQAAPKRVGTASSWTAVSSGGIHVCGHQADGSLWCWGEGSYGRLGTGDAWREALVLTQ